MIRNGFSAVPTAVGIGTLLALTGCSNPPTDPSRSTGTPVPGTITVAVASNPANVSALTFTISGGEADVAQTTGAGIAFSETVAGATRIAVVLPGPADGPLLTIRVPDVGTIDRYRVVVDEAADASNEIVGSNSVTLVLQ